MKAEYTFQIDYYGGESEVEHIKSIPLVITLTDQGQQDANDGTTIVVEAIEILESESIAEDAAHEYASEHAHEYAAIWWDLVYKGTKRVDIA